ncbi:DUF397 domain-containing protein [Embleya sp. NPDC059237]|uniref:DUF397 domain-containing protein n=1 Tax=Embleya sp. NPDC059237 TaxID=3346784 RepID=UPI0036A7B3C6
MTKKRTEFLSWRKSSHSGQNAQECVEVGTLHDAIGTRDSKDPSVGHITITPESWLTLLDSIKA